MNVWNRPILALALLWLGVQTSEATNLDTLRLDMGTAVREALSHNAAVTTADLEVTRTQYNRYKAYGALLPQTSLSASYGYTLKKQRVYFGSGDDAKPNPMSSFFPDEGIEMGQRHNIQAGVQASMPLVMPQLWASLKLEDELVATAIEAARASRVGMVSQVRKAYIGALLAKEAAMVLRQSYEQLRQTERDIDMKLKKGLVAEYDLVRMQAQVQNLLPEVLRAEEAERLSLRKLAVLMNLPLDKPISPTERLEQYERIVELRLLSSETDFRLEGNTTLRSLDHQGRQLEQALRIKKMAYLPTLAASFSYNYSFANDRLALGNSKRWSPHSMLGLSLSIPIFSGGSKYNDVRATRLQLTQLAQRRVQVERELELAHSSALSEQRSAAEVFLASRGAERSALQGYEIALMRYSTGIGTLLELNDAQVALMKAQLSLKQAIHNYMVATYSLDELEGREQL